MSGARQRKRKTLRTRSAEILAIQLGHLRSVEAKQIGKLHSQNAKNWEDAVTLKVYAENTVRCLTELRKEGKLGMFCLAEEFKQIIQERVTNDAAPLVAFAALRSMQDVNDIATLFTALVIDERTWSKT